ncbi:MAG: hypothetical protein EBQ82_03850, partial [Betaproteobacteria bacterium]|nr:hypothetical protein [Betaproteobacteria bacterium]
MQAPFYGLTSGQLQSFTPVVPLPTQGQRAIKACRRWAWAGLAALALALGHSAQAQGSGTFPNRPIKWIVPFAAGGSGDTIARLLSERLGAALGQPVLIDNRGGNGSVLG